MALCKCGRDELCQCICFVVRSVVGQNHLPAHKTLNTRDTPPAQTVPPPRQGHRPKTKPRDGGPAPSPCGGPSEPSLLPPFRVRADDGNPTGRGWASVLPATLASPFILTASAALGEPLCAEGDCQRLKTRTPAGSLLLKDTWAAHPVAFLDCVGPGLKRKMCK
eukprot:SAG25_NODE_376_length_8856_cov_9.128354_10_plen_164_part_00